MEHPGRLGGVLRIGVVTKRVEEWTASPAEPIAHRQGEDESRRVVPRGCGADDVDRSGPSVQDVVATREKSGIRAGTVVLRPIGRRVRLVPDLDVVEERKPPD